MNRRKTIYLTVFCAYLAAIALLCFARPENLPQIDVKTFLGIPIDKILHFFMFLPYTILAGLTFIGKDMRAGACTAVLILAVVTGAGISYGTEAIQAKTGYRAYEIRDFYADVTGMMTGTLAAVAYLIKTRLDK